MNVSVLNVVLFTSGIVLIYSGIKNVNPVQLVKDALEGKVTVPGGGEVIRGEIPKPPNVIVPNPDGTYPGADPADGSNRNPAVPNPDGSFGR